MANTYSPESLGISAPSGGFQQGGWYNGRQYWAGSLSDPGVIHPLSDQQGAGQAVSAEVNAQSAAQQGVSPQQFQSYLQQQSQTSQYATPQAVFNPLGNQNYQGYSSGASSNNTQTTGMANTGFNQPTIDLAKIYQDLFNTSGINKTQEEYDALNKQITDMEMAKNKALATINDNPYYSEGTRVGRAAKLNEQFGNDIANLTNKQKILLDSIATKKADIETQLNIQTKQFDINSQQAQLALEQFNTLLGLGAFDNPSGEDIANITRATGLSSGMIQNAIQANKAKNLQTSIQSYDDGVNQGFKIFTIDPYGNIVNSTTQIVGPSKTSNKTSNNILSGYGNIGNLWEEIDTPNSINISDGWANLGTSSNSQNSQSNNMPTFSPASGFGSVWIDPTTGQSYQYSQQGWVNS